MTSSPTPIKPLPCAFCGFDGEPGIWYVSEVLAYAYCQKCRASGPEEHENHVIEGWNRRSPSVAPASVGEDDKPWAKPDGNDYHVNAFIFAGLDEITAINVGRFAKALAMKLLAAKEKYGYTDGWAQPGWEEQCRAALMEHIGKGDPIDVAAFAMFMWKHQWSTSSPSAVPVACKHESYMNVHPDDAWCHNCGSLRNHYGEWVNPKHSRLPELQGEKE